MKRYECLDVLRGITLISMITFHAMWDLVYIAGVQIDWFETKAAYVWQQSICWTFILLAGFCWSLGRRKVRRGLIVSAAGALVTLVTLIVTPGQRVIFGVLTLLGCCMLLMIPLDKVMRRVPEIVGLCISFILFLFTKTINEGYLGLGGKCLIELPKSWYEKGYLMTFLGCADRRFYSADYFSLLPWLFLFITGYFLYRITAKKEILDRHFAVCTKAKLLAFLGRNSLIIYLLHQPIIYVVVMFLPI